MIKRLRLAVLPLLLLVATVAAAQTNRVTVTVTDSAAEPLPGAFVQIEGTQSGTATDLDGRAVLEKVPEGAIVKVTMLGFADARQQVGGRSAVNIVLQTDTQALEEVVVIGYGTAKRKDFVGSVSSVRLENSPVALMNNSNALETLKGTVAGLDIGAVSNAGGQPSMQMRGQRSISGSNAPLIVVDGAIYIGGLNEINPADIATIDVLKDASSAAAFGSRSSNGVILITTKKGTTEKPVVTFNVSAGPQFWSNKPKLLSPDHYIQAVQDRLQSTDVSWMTPQEKENYDAGIVTDWLDFATRIGLKQDYQASVSGVGKRVNYYLSGSWAGNNGIVVGDDFQRTSLLCKISTDITSWLNLAIDGAYTQQDYSGVAANIGTAYFISPYGQPYRFGTTLLEKYPVTQSDGYQNPLWQADPDNRHNKEIRDSYRLNTAVTVKCPWVEGLSFKLNFLKHDIEAYSENFVYENYYVKDGSYKDETRYAPSTLQGFLVNANGSIKHEKTNGYVLDMILNYAREFGRHSVDATLVSTRDWTTYDWDQTSGSNFSSNGNTLLGIAGLQKADHIEFAQNGSSAANVGYLARVMYSFDKRYSLTASYRRDGSSFFGVNKKWGNFFSFGAAWTPSSEAFWSDGLRATLTDLKVKASWGRNGNQGLPAFGTLSAIQNGTSGGMRYEFDGDDIVYGLIQSGLGNPELGWESTDALNVGFESAWFGGRLHLDVDGYYSQTHDQIFSRDIPIPNGFERMSSSMGQIDNWGVEATLGGTLVRAGDFAWNTGFTFWWSRNKLVHLYGEDLDGDGKEDDDVASSRFIGHGLGAIYGYVQDGIVQVDDYDYIGIYGTEPGYPKYVDLTGDDRITTEDRTILGYTSPNFKLNWHNTLSWRGLELYAMLTGTFGGDHHWLRSNPNAYRINGYGYPTGNCLDIPYWTEENPSNIYPKASFTSDSRFIGLQDRTFVRLQDITLTYNFPRRWLSRANVGALKVYLTGRNLLTLTKWVGDDPETGSYVLTNAMPVAKSLSLGMTINF
ncbi:MAG: SusC/RagA family TonB-linked outer membrane protein [Bacteroidales bacterium]|nr:SusC/RagA family TonB-linked outer membrane protein [Bacteroidales bacterium]